jgi:hypothetical protein
MRRLDYTAILFLTTLSSACGDARSGCELAQEKLDECNAANADPRDPLRPRLIPLATKGECSQVNACVAPCINATSCTTLTWVYFGGQGDPTAAQPADAGRYLGCMRKCMEL